MSKSEADWCKKVEIWWLLRNMKDGTTFRTKTISWGENGDRGCIQCDMQLWGDEPYVRFYYTITRTNGEKKVMDYKSYLIKTPCHLGGYRYWFECPLIKSGVPCKRRVGILYEGGDYFGCRHCYELTYSSRKANKRYRFYPMFRVLELDQQIEKAYKKAKRYTYRGRPTKQRRKIARLDAEMFHYYRRFEAVEKGLEPYKKGRKK